MGLIDKLRRVGGIAKNRLSSAVGALRGTRVTGTARLGRIARVTAIGARLTSPAGLAITAATFAPQIVRGVRRAARFIGQQVVPRAGAFIAARRVGTAIAGGAGAGGIVGALQSRPKGDVTRPSDGGFVQRAAAARVTGRPGGAPAARRRPSARANARTRAATRRRTRRAAPRRRIPTHRHKVVSVPVKRRRKTVKRRTHRSPRHTGHKKVTFTTASGKRVSFLANPKARHR